MSLTRLNRSLFKRFVTSKYSTNAADSEYTASPQYPQILDLSFEATLARKKRAEYDVIQKVKTVEEKQIKLNMPKYYGFKCYLLHENNIPYNQLDFVQHITKTHLIEDRSLPEFYNGITVNVDENVRNKVEDAILTDLHYYRKKHDFYHRKPSRQEQEKLISEAIARSLNRILLNVISKLEPHLKDVAVDWEPRIESFWFAGGMNPPENVKRCRRAVDYLKRFENEPFDRAIQYFGSPILHLRSELPLRPIVPYSEAENTSLEVPYHKYDPRVVGVSTEHRHVTNIPGFWPGDKSKFGLLSFHDRSHLLEEKLYDLPDHHGKDSLHRQGILASFAWLNAQANYFGFTTFNDVTYPTVTQTIITNGKVWSFYLYQLNTISIYSKYVADNPKRNICWAIPELKLFEEINENKLVGFNDDVLKILLKLYANAPEERLGVNMAPYLSGEEQVSADYDDPEKAEWLEREYKHLMSNRERHMLDYEVYNWEKIYKIDHKTRPMDARRRPFELFQNPMRRKLNDRLPRYIPRALRPHLPRSKGRYANEYWP